MNSRERLLSAISAKETALRASSALSMIFFWETLAGTSKSSP
jgi:hypothetical protein